MNIRFSRLKDDAAPSDPAERLFGINGLDEPREKWRQGVRIEDLLGRPPYRLDAPVGANRPNRPSDVFAVQALLDRTGHYAPAAGPSGVYTAELDDAIHAFQEKNGLKSDGVLLERGPTLKTLEQQAFNPALLISRTRKPARKMPAELPDDLQKFAPILGTGGIDLQKNAEAAENMRAVWNYRFY